MFKVLAVLGVSLAALLGNAKMLNAQTSPVTAIDIALEPDATMMEHAKADNARLLKVFPGGFALDATMRTLQCCNSLSVRLTSIRSTSPRTRF